MRLLHLSCDYPDPLAPAKTRAVSGLLALTRGALQHHVYSLNRVDWRFGVSSLGFDDAAGEDHRAVAYAAPGKSLLLQTFLRRLADWVVEDVTRRGLVVDLVHAHKLSVEGLVGAEVARRLGAPLAVSSQGDSDLKIIGARRDLRSAWRRIWREADVALPFAPWTAQRLAAMLGPRGRPTHVMPCPVGADRPAIPRVIGPTLRSAFHFGVARRKNAAMLIKAVGQAARTAPDLRLEILGGGDPEAFARLARMADAAAPGRVAFLGAQPRERVLGLLGESAAFVMPSRRESFGMVFVEALFAGAPILIPQGWGIDGYLDEAGVSVAVDAGDLGSIAEGVTRLAREEAAFKQRLAALGAAGGLDAFRDASIAALYVDAARTAAARTA